MKFAIAFVFSLLVFVTSFSSEKENTALIPNPVELGQVNWLRNFAQAQSLAKKQNKALLILFQEVPGCSTCRHYGKNVLSHPLIVDAIEHEFIPLAIYNNKGGEDKKVLKAFGEPAWNNPVVRIINADGKALSPRIAAKYTPLDLVEGMQVALNNHQQSVPAYLKSLGAQLAGERVETETATFGMYCFWSGESKLGNINGVLSSKPGFMNGGEVVSVEYNPDVISYEELTKIATKKSCYDRILVHSDEQKAIAQKWSKSVKKAGKFRLDKDPQYYLSKSVYRFLPLLPIQASQINSKLARRETVGDLLSPSQRNMLKSIQKSPNKDWKVRYDNKYFAASWEAMETQIK
ncbi:MAG: VPGUxxT family thioredoxin-like (seleno)protein, type 2 [Bacteroidota bacterium]